MNALRRRTGSAAVALLLSAAAAVSAPTPAHAQLMLSEVIVDLAPGKPLRADIEAWNNTDERMYVVAEPSEILSAGQSGETRARQPDPEKLGLLVSPARMILEPGQHKLIRLSAIAPRAGTDRVYRVTVKPVAGEVVAEQTALKVMVGYDVLVMLRPETLRAQVDGQRSGKTITLRNRGNTNVELIEGRQCDAGGQKCKELPAKRLYPGATWEQALNYDTPVRYLLKTATQVVSQSF